MGVDHVELVGRIERGRLRIRHSERWIEQLRSMRDGDVLISIRRGTRSMQANACYWAGYVRPLSEYTGYSPLEIHAYLKAKFLPRPRLLIAKRSGEIIDDAVVTPTTTTLTPTAFSEFLERVSTFAGELGVITGPRVLTERS